MVPTPQELGRGRQAGSKPSSPLWALLGACLFGLGLSTIGCQSEVEVHHDRARELRDAGMTEEAIKEFEAALAIDPDHSPSHYRLAHIYWNEVEEPDLEKAIHHFQRTTETDPTEYKAWEKEAGLLAEVGRPEEAIQVIENGLKGGYFDDHPDRKEDAEILAEKLRSELAQASSAQ